MGDRRSSARLRLDDARLQASLISTSDKPSPPSKGSRPSAPTSAPMMTTGTSQQRVGVRQIQHTRRPLSSSSSVGGLGGDGPSPARLEPLDDSVASDVGRNSNSRPTSHALRTHQRHDGDEHGDEIADEVDDAAGVGNIHEYLRRGSSGVKSTTSLHQSSSTQRSNRNDDDRDGGAEDCDDDDDEDVRVGTARSSHSVSSVMTGRLSVATTTSTAMRAAALAKLEAMLGRSLPVHVRTSTRRSSVTSNTNAAVSGEKGNGTPTSAAGPDDEEDPTVSGQVPMMHVVLTRDDLARLKDPATLLFLQENSSEFSKYISLDAPDAFAPRTDSIGEKQDSRDGPKANDVQEGREEVTSPTEPRGADDLHSPTGDIAAQRDLGGSHKRRPGSAQLGRPATGTAGDATGASGAGAGLGASLQASKGRHTAGDIAALTARLNDEISTFITAIDSEGESYSIATGSNGALCIPIVDDDGHPDDLLDDEERAMLGLAAGENPDTFNQPDADGATDSLSVMRARAGSELPDADTLPTLDEQGRDADAFARELLRRRARKARQAERGDDAPTVSDDETAPRTAVGFSDDVDTSVAARKAPRRGAASVSGSSEGQAPESKTGGVKLFAPTVGPPPSRRVAAMLQYTQKGQRPRYMQSTALHKGTEDDGKASTKNTDSASVNPKDEAAEMDRQSKQPAHAAPANGSAFGATSLRASAQLSDSHSIDKSGRAPSSAGKTLVSGSAHAAPVVRPQQQRLTAAEEQRVDWLLDAGDDWADALPAYAGPSGISPETGVDGAGASSVTAAHSDPSAGCAPAASAYAPLKADKQRLMDIDAMLRAFDSARNGGVSSLPEQHAASPEGDSDTAGVVVSRGSENQRSEEPEQSEAIPEELPDAIQGETVPVASSPAEPPIADLPLTSDDDETDDACKPERKPVIVPAEAATKDGMWGVRVSSLETKPTATVASPPPLPASPKPKGKKASGSSVKTTPQKQKLKGSASERDAKAPTPPQGKRLVSHGKSPRTGIAAGPASLTALPVDSSAKPAPKKTKKQEMPAEVKEQGPKHETQQAEQEAEWKAKQKQLGTKYMADYKETRQQKEAMLRINARLASLVMEVDALHTGAFAANRQLDLAADPTQWQWPGSAGLEARPQDAPPAPINAPTSAVTHSLDLEKQSSDLNGEGGAVDVTVVETVAIKPLEEEALAQLLEDARREQVLAGAGRDKSVAGRTTAGFGVQGEVKSLSAGSLSSPTPFAETDPALSKTNDDSSHGGKLAAAFGAIDLGMAPASAATTRGETEGSAIPPLPGSHLRDLSRPVSTAAGATALPSSVLGRVADAQSRLTAMEELAPLPSLSEIMGGDVGREAAGYELTVEDILAAEISDYDEEE